MCLRLGLHGLVGPGDLPQVRYQCMRETGGSEIDELGPERDSLQQLGDRLQTFGRRLGGDFKTTPATDRAEARALDGRRYLFMACMESKGYTRQRVSN